MYHKYMIFYDFIVAQFFSGKVYMTDKKSEPLQTEFDASAAPAQACAGAGCGRVIVTLEIDADLLAWLQLQPTDWQREINNTMRFFMETSNPPSSYAKASEDRSPGKAYGRKTDIFPF
jgi:uncharacterized protein (DUF4415 family)